MLKLLHFRFSMLHLSRSFASVRTNDTKITTASGQQLHDDNRLTPFEHKEMSLKYGRPKHPGSVFQLFCVEYQEENSINLSRQEHSRRWRGLNPEEKAEYSRQHLTKLTIYRKELQCWREKMTTKGLKDIVKLLDSGKRGKGLYFIRPEPRNDLSFKKEYSNQFHSDLDIYHLEMRDWKAKMISSGYEDIMKKLEGRNHNSPLPTEFNKPAYPKLPMERFREELSAGKSELINRDDSRALWNELSPAEKGKYSDQFDAEKVEYEKNLQDWKSNLVASGHKEIMKYQERSRRQRTIPKTTIKLSLSNEK